MQSVILAVQVDRLRQGDRSSAAVVRGINALDRPTGRCVPLPACVCVCAHRVSHVCLSKRRLRSVKMEQRKLSDQANTLVDLSKREREEREKMEKRKIDVEREWVDREGDFGKEEKRQSEMEKGVNEEKAREKE
ncbi:hypothetical protein WMY93_030884 [Mugilogobius chulae]|uniref:Calmodulin-binding domain-containing protein n=1 Tax=Mugilogobius chulae TaxID=88201 RepID=A0AAW0MF59_9GOBI